METQMITSYWRNLVCKRAIQSEKIKTELNGGGCLGNQILLQELGGPPKPRKKVLLNSLFPLRHVPSSCNILHISLPLPLFLSHFQLIHRWLSYLPQISHPFPIVHLSDQRFKGSLSIYEILSLTLVHSITPHQTYSLTSCKPLTTDSYLLSSSPAVSSSPYAR